MATWRLEAAVAATALAGAIGCRTPTEATIDITTNAACDDVAGTGVAAGPFETLEQTKLGASTEACAGKGDIGSLVLLPPDGDKNAPFAFRVVTSLDASLDDCQPPDYGPSCIVARRAMRFVPHDPFHVPVRMDVACAGVRCPEEQTCVAGTCQSITIDPTKCTAPAGCEPKPGESPPFTKHVGGPGSKLARHIAVGADGTIALTGTFDDSIDLGDGPIKSRGSHDAFLATYSQTGLLRWALGFGGAGIDEAASVAIDSHGAVYLMVSFSGTVDFGGGKLTSAGGQDVALVKLSSFGKFLWAISFGGGSGDSPAKLAFDPSGNVLVAGSFSGSTKIGGTKLDSAGGGDMFLASFTPSGDVRWAKALGGPGDETAGGLGVDDAGKLYLAGTFAGTTKLGDQSFDSAGSNDGLVASFDDGGDLRWVKTFGSKGNDVIGDLAARGKQVVVTGSLHGTATIDGQPVGGGAGSGFLAAFRTDGKLAWAQGFGDLSGMGSALDLGADGTIAVAGQLSLGAVFGSNQIVSAGSSTSPFVALLDASGSPRWARAFQSTKFGTATAVAAPGHDFALVAGWFQGGLDLAGDELTAEGTDDLFFARLAAP